MRIIDNDGKISKTARLPKSPYPGELAAALGRMAVTPDLTPIELLNAVHMVEVDGVLEAAATAGRADAVRSDLQISLPDLLHR